MSSGGVSLILLIGAGVVVLAVGLFIVFALAGGDRDKPGDK